MSELQKLEERLEKLEGLLYKQMELISELANKPTYNIVNNIVDNKKIYQGYASGGGATVAFLDDGKCLGYDDVKKIMR